MKKIYEACLISYRFLPVLHLDLSKRTFISDFPKRLGLHIYSPKIFSKIPACLVSVVYLFLRNKNGSERLFDAWDFSRLASCPRKSKISEDGIDGNRCIYFLLLNLNVFFLSCAWSSTSLFRQYIGINKLFSFLVSQSSPSV